MEINLTRMSSKGQIVIPVGMRENFHSGDNLILIRDDDRIVIKKADKLTEQLQEDLEFARRSEEAFKRIESGRFISVDSDNLFEEMSKW